MKGRQDCCDAVQPGFVVLVIVQQGGQLALLREGTHDNHMVDGFAIHDDIGHSEVHVWCHPAIELHFSVAVRGPSTALPEVQEVEMNGFVELIGLVSEEENNRNVRLRDTRWCGNGRR